MKKDKLWAKLKIRKELESWQNIEGGIDEDGINYVLNIIDQVDEPGILSRELPVIPKYVAEWIEVNKQSEEKWSDYDKEDAINDTIHFTIYGLFADYPATNSHVELRNPVLKWLSIDRGNYFKLVNAVRYGYEVEEEPLYRARLKVITDKFIASYLRTQSSDTKYRLKALEIGSKYIHEDHRHLSEFTENELKRLGIWGSEQWEVEELEVEGEEDER